MLVALILTWLAPVVNCDGSALDDLAGYTVTWEARRCWGVVEDTFCTARDVRVGVIWPATMTMTVLRLYGEPAVGAAWWWRVEAVDANGHTSEECMP